eukprot:14372254-Ditylum_brightwellii.AAC.1
MGSWQRLGMFYRVSEVQNSGVVQGWVKLDADGTLKKGCKSLLRIPMVGYKNVPGGHTKN